MKPNTTAIKIEQIHSFEQLEQCIEIMIEAYNCEPWCDAWTYETALAFLSCCFQTPNFMGWVATSGNQVVGCCIGNSEPYYTGSNYYLRDLFVSVKAQKMGIGNQLLATMKAGLEAQGIKTIILFTRKSIVDFYVRAGFSEMTEMAMMICTNQ